MSEEQSSNVSRRDVSRTEVSLGDMERRDPLGEIRHFAVQLWKDAGGKAESSWQDFFPEAEEMLMHGRGNAPRGPVHVVVRRKAPIEGELSPELQRIVEDSEDEVLSVLASAFRHFLTEHESHCLFSLLSSHLLDLPGWKTVGPFGVEEVAGYLAEIAGEYSSSFLGEQGAKKPQEVPLEARKYYWEKLLRRQVQEDAALSFHDRNTMARLKFRLEEEPRVLAVSHVDIS